MKTVTPAVSTDYHYCQNYFKPGSGNAHGEWTGNKQ